MEQENAHNLVFSNANKEAFYDFKEQLKDQYSRLGYTNIAIDKENSFMMKSSTLQNSYIHLKMNEANKEITIDCFNTEKPTLVSNGLIKEVKTLTHEEIEKLKHDFLITTELCANFEIIERLGVVSAQCIFGVNFIKDIFSFVRDIIGGRINSLEVGLEEATEAVLNELQEKALLKNANAIIGLKIEHTYNNSNSGNILSVYATGTAVKIK
jgi:uncharacterized protein YbjQ (UPF0145 family)